jgi:hypothetical protein
MPNHIHGILIFNKNDASHHHHKDAIPRKDAIYRVSPTTLADIAPDNPRKDAIYRVSPTPPADIATPTTPAAVVATPSRDAINRVFTKAGGITGIHNPMLQTNLGRIMRWFKGRVSFECRSHIDFAWLERYHDEVIHNNERLNNVRAYIFNNPANWEDDEWNVI